MALLEIREVTRSFGGLVALDKVDLDVSDLSVVGLIGPNGAGKTTLFDVITGLCRPDSGSVFLDGHDLAGHPPYEIARHKIGRTFQNIRLFSSLSVLENVLVGSHLRSNESVWQALVGGSGRRKSESGLADHALEVLHLVGLSGHRNEQARSLPYGAQRKLEIARALASKPRLLLLDEPAAGLNSQETTDLQKLVRMLRDEKGLTILLIEHDMRFVMGLCENICVLDYGEVIACGAPQDIRDDPRVIEAYLGEAPA